MATRREHRGHSVLRMGTGALALVVATAGLATWSARGGPVPVDEEGAPHGTFSALTYNVAGLPAVLSGSEPVVNTPFISPLLNPYDLVLVQEDWQNPDPPLPGLEVFHDVLVSEATHPYQSDPAPVPLGANPARPSALVSDGLNRLSRFPLGEVTRVMWPNCFGGLDTSDGGAGDCLSEKGFSLATMELDPGITVDVYNLHAEAGSKPLDEKYSAEDFATLSKFIVSNSAGRPVIVGGDFNLHTERAPDDVVFARFLATTGLTDVCSAVDCGDDANEIDKFLFRDGSGLDIEPLSHRFERELFVRPTDGAPLSDHDALHVDFGWSVKASGVSGTVTDPEGHPVPGALVWVLNEVDRWSASALGITDEEGRYSARRLSAGSYRLLVAPPRDTGLARSWYGDVHSRISAAPVVLDDLENRSGLDVSLIAAGRGSGTVTDTSGSPVEGARIYAYASIDVWVGSGLATTGPDGSYSLERLAPDGYRLRFFPPEGSGLAPVWMDGAPTRSAAPLIELTADAETTGLDAVLPPAP